MTSVRRSLAQTFTGRYIGLVLGITSNMILARLLLPEEVGIFSVCAAILGFIHVFRDFGAGQYLVRETELNEAKIRTCFGLSFGIAWLLGFSLLVVVDPIVEFYGDPALGPVLVVMVGALLVIPFNSIRLGLLRRRMQFGTLMYVEIASAGANAIVAIVLAALGFGPLSLAFGVFASILATYAIYCFRTIETDIWPPTTREWRSVLGFGTKSIGVNLLHQTSERSAEVIVGRISGLHETGILSRAMGLLNLFSVMITSAVYSVAFSAVAERHRNGEDIAADYVRIVAYVSALAFPFFTFIYLLALPTIRLLFGPNWDESAPLAQVLCLIGVLTPFVAFNGSFFIVLGKIGTDLRIMTIFTPFKVLCWLLAGPYGLLVAVKAFVAVNFLYAAVSVFILHRALRFSWVAFAKATLHGVAILVPSAAAPWLVSRSSLASDWGNFAACSIAGISMVALWLAAIFALRHPFRDEIALVFAHLRGSAARRHSDPALHSRSADTSGTSVDHSE